MNAERKFFTVLTVKRKKRESRLQQTQPRKGRYDFYSGFWVDHVPWSLPIAGNPQPLFREIEVCGYFHNCKPHALAGTIPPNNVSRWLFSKGVAFAFIVQANRSLWTCLYSF